jgi:hypothetical protein
MYNDARPLFNEWRTRFRIEKLLGLAPEYISQRLYRQIRGEWNDGSLSSPSEVDARLEILCAAAKTSDLTELDVRIEQAKDKEYSQGRPISRKESLRLSANAALDFDLPVEKREDRVFVDITSIHPQKKFTVLVIDDSFLADLKRFRLRLKDGKAYADTFRWDRLGARTPHLVPLSSIVAAKKYGKNWDYVFLTARTVSGDALDLRATNVVIPSCEKSQNTATMNEKFNKNMAQAGFHDGLLTTDPLFARPKKAAGYGPDADERQTG